MNMPSWVLLTLTTLVVVCDVGIGSTVVKNPQVSHKHATFTTSSPSTTSKYGAPTPQTPTQVIANVSSDAATVATKGISASVSTTTGVRSSQATTKIPATTTVPSTTTQTTTTPDPRINKTVCYGILGCFDNYPPFDNANLHLPVDPDMIGTGFWLYTRANNNVNDYDVLNFREPSSARASRFDPKKLTKVLVHGFNNNGNTSWVQRFRHQLLVKGDFNVIVVDWGRGAKFGDYDQAVANTRLVATQLKLVLEMLMGAGLDLEDVHLLGHSLGAHTSGYTGRLLDGKISRISGFDPADPEYRNYPLAVRLDKTDAKFVDVTHTNAGGLGIETASGHVDFYVNGGANQPGCAKGLFSAALSSLFGHGDVGKTVGCSHGRSYDVFMESMLTWCPFTSYPCSSYDAFQKGQCLTCGQRGCTQYGYYSDQFYARGKMYLNTATKPPYCGYHYGVKIETKSTQGTKGQLYIKLTGTWGTTDFISVTGDESISAGAVVQKVVVSPDVVGDLTSVAFKYKKHTGFFWNNGKSSLKVGRITVTSGENGYSYLFCFGQDVPHNTETRSDLRTSCS